MTNSTLIDRKTKVVCKFKTRRGGAEVQLPPAGTGPASASATGERLAGDGMVLYVSTDLLARRGLWHRAQFHGPGGIGTTPRPSKNAGWSRRSACRAHAPEVAGSNPAPAILTPGGVGNERDTYCSYQGNNAHRSQTGIQIVCVTRLGQLGNISAATVTFMGINSNSHGTEVRFLPEASGKRRVLQLIGS